MSLDEILSALKTYLAKPTGKIFKISLAVLLSFIFVCCCLFTSIFSSDKPAKQAQRAPTMDFNDAVLTSVAETIAAVPTFTPLPTYTPLSPGLQPTIALQPSPTQYISGPQGNIPPCIRPQEPQTALVTEVVDGDTIKVSMDGAIYSVRYIGIDTPESANQIEPFGKEAAAQNAELVSGKQVVMYRDVSETDKFDRILRFVFVGDAFVNYELVRRGYANAFRYPPDVSCADYFAEAERDARSSGVGFWAAQATYESSSPQATLVIVAVNKVAEFVDVKNESSSPIDLAGWRLVSEKGSQTCNLGGIIQPRETLRIYAQTGENGFNCNFAKTIWNNSEPDPAVLYNPDGVEVSRK